MVSKGNEARQGIGLVIDDFIYDIFDALFLASEFNSADLLIQKCIRYEYLIKDDILLAILTSTSPAKSELPNRKFLVDIAFFRNLPINGLE